MKPGQDPFASNPVLFGRDDSAAMLAAELQGDDRIVVYRRENGRVVSETHPFQPFLWLIEPVFLQGFGRKVEYVPLTGRGEFQTRAVFQSWRDCLDAQKFLGSASCLAIADPVQQFLTATGRTSFKGLAFDQLHRLQLALVTSDGERLRAIQLADSRGWQQELAGTEKELLAALVEIVGARDPDVLEGHDLFRTILPRLIQCARDNSVPLNLGRDGQPPRVRPSRLQIAEHTVQYPRCQIHGRHAVDTQLLTRFYDVATRELERFGLEDVAAHFGLDPATARTAPLAVARISELLSPGFFVQARIFPYNYQDIVLRGNATKIDALFLREYHHQRHAIPQLAPTRPFSGGYTDLFQEGLVRNVWHCDVQSLYPSLMLAGEIQPRRDALRLFLPLLRDLRTFRLEAKAIARQGADLAERRHAEVLQQAFKILINSFYGYLGFAQAHFGDVEAAAQVAARGRETLQQMLDWLRQRGARVIEIDTDGLYFVPPPQTEPDRLEADLQAVLPRGVDVEIDGRYPAMFSYKMKNYALLDDSGRVHITGSALRSRGLEKYLRRFLADLLALALRGQADEVPARYEQTCQRLERRELPIEWLAKTDTLQETLAVYRQKLVRSARHRNAAYELALQSGRAFQPGDPISYYVTGDAKRVSVVDHCKRVEDWDPQRRDENVEYYLDKLRALYKKFIPLLKTKGARP